MIIPIHVYNIISTDNRFIDTLMILGDSNEMRKVGDMRISMLRGYIHGSI
jgi:hypothetical protein